MQTLSSTHLEMRRYRIKSSLGLFIPIVWFLYVVLSPVYIVPKGLPQPADFLLILGLLPALAAAFLQFNGRVPLLYVTGILFCFLTFTINWVNYIYYPDMRLALSSVYYIYNFLVFCFVVHIFSRDYPLITRLTYIGLVIAIIMQTLWATFLPDPGVKRMTAGFLNPNQLAYWSLLCAGMIFYLRRYERFTKLDLLLFFLVGYIQTLALSKAGIISYAVMVVILVFSPQMPRLGKILVAFSVCLGCAYLLFDMEKAEMLYSRVAALERVIDRLETLGTEGDDSAEGRGYYRIIENPQYVFVGAGEGAFERFRTWTSPNELHSGLATIVFSYGIFGLFLLLTLISLTVYRQNLSSMAVMFSIILYGVTSQSFRFTHFWVLLGMAYATFMYHPKTIAWRLERQKRFSLPDLDRQSLQNV